jgi:hypothetical protein
MLIQSHGGDAGEAMSEYDALEKRLLAYANEFIGTATVHEAADAIRELRAANSALGDTIHLAWNERDRLAGSLAVCGVIAHEGDGTCLPEYETDSVLAVRKLRAERDAAVELLRMISAGMNAGVDSKPFVRATEVQAIRAFLAAQERKL